MPIIKIVHWKRHEYEAGVVRENSNTTKVAWLYFYSGVNEFTLTFEDPASYPESDRQSFTLDELIALRDMLNKAIATKGEE
jgi:hypothetical protein